MTAPFLPDALPYGVRDCKLTKYADAVGSILGDKTEDLPNMQTLSFTETEEFQELRGDDRVVTTRGQGAQAEWSLEAGGISLRCWAIFTGGEVIEEGLTPNKRIILRKFGTTQRPFFRVEGQAMSDSGGDMHTVLYRCRCNSTIEGQFADGEFFVTSVSGLALPLLDEDFDLLYDIIQNETAVSTPDEPEANPIGFSGPPTPGALTATTAVVNWDAVNGAATYDVEQAISPYTTWTAAAGGAGIAAPTKTATITGLTAATAYKFRVKANPGGSASQPSAVITTTA